MEWSKDKIADFQGKVTDALIAAKKATGADQLLIVAVFHEGQERHVFDAAESELTPVQLYTRMLEFHMADAVKPTVN
jgi:hypothetical protein